MTSKHEWAKNRLYQKWFNRHKYDRNAFHLMKPLNPFNRQKYGRNAFHLMKPSILDPSAKVREPGHRLSLSTNNCGHSGGLRILPWPMHCQAHTEILGPMKLVQGYVLHIFDSPWYTSRDTVGLSSEEPLFWLYFGTHFWGASLLKARLLSVLRLTFWLDSGSVLGHKTVGNSPLWPPPNKRGSEELIRRNERGIVGDAVKTRCAT